MLGRVGSTSRTRTPRWVVFGTRQPGFTLVELLVAVGIVALLAGIVLSIAVGARRAGKRATCANQMKQIATALVMYRDRYGEYPPILEVRSHGSADNMLVTWQEVMLGEGVDARLFQCPSFRGDLASVRGQTYEYQIGPSTSPTPGAGDPDAVRYLAAVREWARRERVLLVCKHHWEGRVLVAREDLSVQAEDWPDFRR